MAAQREDEGRGTFDLAPYLRKIRTKQGVMDYLDAKGRVAWMRHEHPDASILTEEVGSGADWARFKATIHLPTTGAAATGHGSETAGDFADFYEKAETKAIARALALLGYGTESAVDLDNGEPLDGRAAAKDERAERRHERQPERVVRPPALARVEPPRPEPPQRVVRFTDAASDAASTRIRECASAKGLTLANEPHRVPWKVVINHIREHDGVVDVADDGTISPATVWAAFNALPDVDEGDEGDDETASVDVAIARDTAGDEAWSPEAVAAIEAQEAREYAAK